MITKPMCHNLRTKMDEEKGKKHFFLLSKTDVPTNHRKESSNCGLCHVTTREMLPMRCGTKERRE